MGCTGNNLVDCLIIYPEKMIDDSYKDESEGVFDDCAQLNSLDDIDCLLHGATPIKGYKGFYKLSIALPYLYI